MDRAVLEYPQLVEARKSAQQPVVSTHERGRHRNGVGNHEYVVNWVRTDAEMKAYVSRLSCATDCYRQEDFYFP